MQKITSPLYNIIEQSVKNLDSLPAAVQKNMMEIRRLDALCQKINLDAQMKVRQLISSWKTVSKDQRKKSLDSLKVEFHRASEMSDEKIRLSEQTYELVDKYICKLDADTAKLNAAVLRKLAGEPAATPGTSEKVEMDGSGSRKRKGTATSAKRDGKRVKKSELIERLVTAAQELPTYANTNVPLVDMPVDPNEPTYCICHQVSFGQMVMCDNKTCPIEWFHFQCVGLTAKPRGKWFCEACAEQRRKKL